MTNTKTSEPNFSDNQFFMSLSQVDSSNKDQNIRMLQEKNDRLRDEVHKIDKIMNKQSQKAKYGHQLPEMRTQVLDKELDNAYKLIKVYDYQVNKLRNIDKDGSFAEQIYKIEQTLKQRKQMSEKLKKQLNSIKKQSMGVVKQLKNNTKKQQNNEKTQQLSSQVKWLREKIREYEIKKDVLNHNAQLQMALLKKYEKQLEEEGFSKGAVEQMKKKYIQLPIKDSKASKTQIFVEQTYDRSPDVYLQHLAEIKLLQKLQKSHYEHIQFLKTELSESFAENLTSRNRVLEIQDEIEKYQARIEELKPKIDPRNLKPQRALSMQDGYGFFGRYSKNKSQLIPVKPPKPAFPHSFKFEEVGSLSKGGRRFSDRGTIGKQISKIVSVDFYTDNATGNLIGLQATYLIKQVFKKSNLNMIVEKKKTTKTIASVSDRNIDCYSDSRDMIVGIGMTSNNNESISVGNLDGSRRPLSISRNECGGCFFGSFCQMGLQLFGVEIVQLEE